MSRLLRIAADVAPIERRAVALAFACNFLLLGSYYILRPVRDTAATIVGVGELQALFTGTFIGTLIASPIYTALASRVRLSRLLPGVFWFWLLTVLLFAALFRLAPANRWVSGSYYIWFSVTNLFMISVFWSLMVDLFSAAQATRLFALIAAGGELGAITGPVLMRVLVARIGLDGMLVAAAGGLVLVLVLVQRLAREKRRLQASGRAQQISSLEHGLSGSALDGFRQLFRSRYALSQAAFMLLMTWVSTVAYFFQTDLVARAFGAIAARAQAIADIDLAVNICTAVILLFGLNRLLRRFGVTGGLVLNPLLMLLAFLGLALAPSLLMIQGLQVVRRVAQYAIARPSREICFTVMTQSGRYKTKNVIDTVVYRFGDLGSAWMQAGLRIAGFGLAGGIAVGVGAAALWAASAGYLGQRYERIRRGAVVSDAAG
ncbi:MAG: NTP/NDP exchange transporter [Steroidobacteraceae bacterium]